MLSGLTKDVSKGDVLRYIFLPQILPRLNDLYRQGFSRLALLIAQVYRAVNILPANHAIFNRKGAILSLTDVLRAAAGELRFNKNNIDKIIIYFAILLGLFLLAAQFLLTLGVLMLNPAYAQMANPPTTYAGFFATPNYRMDIAYNLLYRVFGVPEIFYVGNGQNPYHTALQALFQLYSIGLLVIGVIITCYYIFAVVVETAQTGVPFGKRYNHVWTPIRLVFALGLLIPVGYGLNSAQWITLYAAKFGSDFATRGWVVFNEAMTNAYLNNPEERVGVPQSPDLTALAGYMMTVDACKYAYETVYKGADHKTINAYLVKDPATGGAARLMTGTTFDQAATYFNNGDIYIRFGQYSVQDFHKYLGNVFSYCGDLIIHTGDISEPGALDMQRAYYGLIISMFTGAGGGADAPGAPAPGPDGAAAAAQNGNNTGYQLKQYGENYVKKYLPGPDQDVNAEEPPTDYKSTVATQLANNIRASITKAVNDQRASASWNKQNTQIADMGWGGAGLWYNKIAQINGSIVSAVNSTPEPKTLPAVLEFVKAKNLQQNVRVAQSSSMNLADNVEMRFNSDTEKNIAVPLTIVANYWRNSDPNQSVDGGSARMTSNFFIDAVKTIFGVRGLYNMCANTDVHPLAQLSMLGAGLIDASISNIFLGLGFGLAGSLGTALGPVLGAASQILTSVATITIVIGFMLYYVLPFMPFLYFFFAVGGWVKGLFEAMVGVPLWALAHLRIDGEGLPGEAAMDGYYLIFEIFLRPILILFGLLASVVIFAAMVKVLNEIYSLVVLNLSGHDQSSTTSCGALSAGGGAGGADGGGGGGGTTDVMTYFRGPVDEFFFTVIYAIIVYMIGMSCFKLIDLIPNNILRFMGQRVQTFNDAQSDPAEGLMTRLSVGGTQVSRSIVGIGTSGVKALGQTGQAAVQAVSGGNS